MTWVFYLHRSQNPRVKMHGWAERLNSSRKLHESWMRLYLLTEVRSKSSRRIASRKRWKWVGPSDINRKPKVLEPGKKADCIRSEVQLSEKRNNWRISKQNNMEFAELGAQTPLRGLHGSAVENISEATKNHPKQRSFVQEMLKKKIAPRHCWINEAVVGVLVLISVKSFAPRRTTEDEEGSL